MKRFCTERSANALRLSIPIRGREGYFKKTAGKRALKLMLREFLTERDR